MCQRKEQKGEFPVRIAAKITDGGYFTIEAAFIVSITCFLVISFWLIAIYIFDLGCVDSCLKEQAALFSVGEMEEQNTVQAAKQELEKNLLAASLERFSVEYRGGQVIGNARISLNIPIPVIGGWLGKRWTNSITVTMEKGNNTTKMRKWDQLE